MKISFVYTCSERVLAQLFIIKDYDMNRGGQLGCLSLSLTIGVTI